MSNGDPTLVGVRLGFPPSCQQMWAPAQTGFPEGVQAHPSQASAPRRGRLAPTLFHHVLIDAAARLRGRPHWPRLLVELLFSVTALRKWGRIWEAGQSLPPPSFPLSFPGSHSCAPQLCVCYKGPLLCSPPSEFTSVHSPARHGPPSPFHRRRA